MWRNKKMDKKGGRSKKKSKSTTNTGEKTEERGK